MFMENIYENTLFFRVYKKDGTRFKRQQNAINKKNYIKSGSQTFYLVKYTGNFTSTGTQLFVYNYKNNKNILIKSSKYAR